MVKKKEIKDEELVDKAQRARDKAYSPYSKFRVGAALLSDTGKVFTGTNVENASYGLTICAERVAVFKAVSEGHTKFKKLAVVSSSEEATFPCGACRQVLVEFSKDLAILMESKSGWIERHKLKDLLPHSFGKGDLK